MNRIEFMEALRNMLSELPALEREEALAYYEGYFEDAGSENEARIIREFGSPGRLAALIKEEVYGAKREEKEEASDTKKSRAEEYKVEKPEGASEIPYEERVTKAKEGSQERKKKNTERVFLVILLCVVASPAIIAIISSIFGILTGFFGAAIGLLIGGVAAFVSGVVLCFSDLPNGLAAMGSGLVLTGVGFLFLPLVIWICGWLCPKIIKLISSGFRRFVGSEGERV